MDTRLTYGLAGFCLLLALSAPALASEKGNLMKMTVAVNMQVPGMPAGMGAMTRTTNVCTSAREPDPSQIMQKQKDCQVSDYKKSGDTITFHMACTGAMQMHGDGKYQLLPDGSLHGTVHIAGTSDGQPVSIDSKVDGTRIGPCDYTPPASEG